MKYSTKSYKGKKKTGRGNCNIVSTSYFIRFVAPAKQECHMGITLSGFAFADTTCELYSWNN